ncbi:MAG: cysteine desulfurase [Lachnospiraceae bacterium]|nr:cysteine desulfurase [Lachnospiraceae bacterium]
MKTIYLDNSATTRVYPEVQKLVLTCMDEEFGNAASLHRMGVEAERRVREAKERIARTLKCEPKQIYFTSGGTESNNWAIRGTAEALRRQGNHLITSAVEHPSVKNVMRYLEEQGFSVTYLPVNEYGEVSLEDLKAALRPETVLVSLMMVNNEIGAVEPVGEIGQYLAANRPDVYFHVDAIQAYGKYDICPKKQHIDLLSVSGHKIHGPKGIGFLYVGDRVKLKPLLFGGGQQKGLRSGTENVPGEAGLGLAAERSYRDLAEKTAHMRELKALLIAGLEELEGARVNGRKDQNSAPHIISCSFDRIRSEVLLHALEDRGICVSSGSACSSSHPSEVSTLLAIGLEKEQQEGTIRFSLSEDTTKEEIDRTLEALRELLPFLRKFTRK